jgi:hypothetical protein
MKTTIVIPSDLYENLVSFAPKFGIKVLHSKPSDAEGKTEVEIEYGGILQLFYMGFFLPFKEHPCFNNEEPEKPGIFFHIGYELGSSATEDTNEALEMVMKIKKTKTKFPHI